MSAQSQVYLRVGSSVCRELTTSHWIDETIEDQCEYITRLKELQQVRALTNDKLPEERLGDPVF